MADDPVPWSVAWRRAAHGPAGFYGTVRGRAEDHFVTSVMSDESVARRLVALAEPTLHELARAGGRVRVTDVGAADGTLIRQLMDLWPTELRDVTDWRAIDVRDRPPDLSSHAAWLQGDAAEVAASASIGPGLVVAHEFLDDVPCDIVEPDDDGHLRLVLVDSSGTEQLGPALDDVRACARLGVDAMAAAQWCAAWWPRVQPAARIEVGTSRDSAWRSIGSLVTDGLAVAIDYGHVLSDRAAGRWDGGTLAAYVDGHPTSPIPDGARNITAHVAVDSCAAALAAVGTTFAPSSEPDDFWWLVQYRERPA